MTTPRGIQCDLRACIPEEGQFTFVAHLGNEGQCKNDALEGPSGNDSPGLATPLELDQDGEATLESLWICSGDLDYYRLEVQGHGYRVLALLTHKPQQGSLLLDLLEGSGTGLLASGEREGGDVYLESDGLQSGDVLLRVKGQDEAMWNHYDLLVAVEKETPANPTNSNPTTRPRRRCR